MALSRGLILSFFVLCASAAVATGFLFSRSLLQVAPEQTIPVAQQAGDPVSPELVLSSAVDPPLVPELELGAQRPHFTHARSDGQWVSMSDFDGAMVLVNFWATWCEPCREEMPLLQRWADQYEQRGLRVVGIALDDVARVREFASTIGIRYPLLVGGPDVVETSQRWGNRRGALPYTVLVDRQGLVRWRHFGPLEEFNLTEELLPWLDDNANTATYGKVE